MTEREQETARKEIPCRPPEPAGDQDFDILDETEFGFRVRHKASGVVYRCAIGWNSRVHWYQEVAS